MLIHRSVRPAGNTTTSVNLRPCTDGAIINIQTLSSLPQTAGNRPVACFRKANGRVFAGSAEGYHCALPLTPLSALAMSAEGPVRIQSDGEPQKLVNDYPPIAFSVRSAGLISVTVPERKLAKGAVNGIIDDADARTLAADLQKAYTELCSKARQMSAAIQPCLVRYRLYDASGRMRFASPPVLLGTANFAGASEVYSSDRITVHSHNPSAQAWQLQADIPEALSDSDIARADIFISPMFHPYDPSMTARVTPGRMSSADEPFARITLPGAELAMDSTAGTAACATLAAAFSRMDAIEKRVASINMPFSRPSTSVFALTFDADPVQSTRSLHKTLAAALTPATRKEALLSAPHSFTAQAVASAGPAVAWGNISVIRYRGYSAANFAAATENKPWRAITAIRFADGSGTVRTEEHESGFPSMLAPITAYPAPDAVEMTVLLYSEGRNYKETFALAPDASGRFAIAVHPSLKAYTPALTGVAQIIDMPEPADEFPETVAFAHIDAPLDICRTERLGNTPLLALAARDISEQSWDMGRSRFVAASASGIYSLAYNASTSRATFRNLSSKGIERRDAICTAPGGEIFFVADSCLWHIGRTGTAQLYDASVPLAATGYNSAAGELWAIPRNGNGAVVYYTAYDGCFTLRTDCSPKEFHTLGGELFATDANPARLLITAEELPGIAVETELGFTRPNKGYGLANAPGTHLAMQAASFDGTVRIAAAHQGGAPLRLIREARIKGALRGSLFIPFVTRHFRALHINIKGTVKAFRIYL